MSTVLEAHRAQQRDSSGVPQPAPALSHNLRSRRWWMIIPIALGALLLVVLAAVVLRRASTPPTAPTAPTAPTTHLATMPPPLARSVARDSDELPRARVGENLVVPPQSASALKPAGGPKVAAVPNPRPPRTDTAGRTASAGALPHSNTDGIHLKSVRYSTDSNRRAATLLIGSQTATLREGESAHGIEVQLILPDLVYVREGGSVSAISPEP